MKEYYLCKLHNEVFKVPETRINTECFLPIWEGVSKGEFVLMVPVAFPPYMGGCIAKSGHDTISSAVSSLYGRVYRRFDMKKNQTCRFLPIWEGVSKGGLISNMPVTFPPYMGGCIVLCGNRAEQETVSSLHGRVYR